MYRASVTIAILLISISASLAKQSENNTKISPAPAPAPSVNSTSSKSVAGGKPIVEETCAKVSMRCQFKSLTACLPNYKTGSQGSFLVVNDGESSIKVKIVVLPANDTLGNIQIPSHHTEKITIPANVGLGSSFLLNAGDENCTIHMGAVAPQTNFYQQFPSYDAYATPTNGVYLFFLVTIIVGGTCACCKLNKKDRHLDGVPYQELEMGNSAVPLSTNVEMDVEAAEGWDQDWDDDWDEDKAVKSPGGSRLNGKPANGLPSRSTESNGWGNDWDD